MLTSILGQMIASEVSVPFYCKATAPNPLTALHTSKTSLLVSLGILTSILVRDWCSIEV